LPSPETPSITGPTTPPTPTPAAAKPTAAKQALDQLGMQTVTPSSAKEVTGDEIPW
jgi:hypothetical protein